MDSLAKMDYVNLVLEKVADRLNIVLGINIARDVAMMILVKPCLDLEMIVKVEDANMDLLVFLQVSVLNISVSQKVVRVILLRLALLD
jgi:hypothetical protein